MSITLEQRVDLIAVKLVLTYRNLFKLTRGDLINCTNNCKAKIKKSIIVYYCAYEMTYDYIRASL